MPTKILAIVPDTMGTDRPTLVGWSSSALEREKKHDRPTNAFCKDTLHHIPPDTHDYERPLCVPHICHRPRSEAHTNTDLQLKQLSAKSAVKHTTATNHNLHHHHHR